MKNRGPFSYPESVESCNEELRRNLVRPKDGHFVGAIYDTSSASGARDVALVVGINYGQIKTSKDSVTLSGEKLGYAAKVRLITGREFETALWNFYPFLTDSEWTRDCKNTRDEAERIFQRGYVDPYAMFDRVVELLDPKVIVFHGITSALPILAYSAFKRMETKRDCYMVANLSRYRATGKEQKMTP